LLITGLLVPVISKPLVTSYIIQGCRYSFNCSRAVSYLISAGSIDVFVGAPSLLLPALLASLSSVACFLLQALQVAHPHPSDSILHMVTKNQINRKHKKKRATYLSFLI
jgi:hypothetical protein